MRITDQYVWNVIFLIFFAILVFVATIILDGEAARELSALSLTDYVLMILATLRVTRLVVYDKIFAFLRDQFYDPIETKNGIELVKPLGGPRRTLADLISCPWCFGVWAGASVSFFYLLSPLAFYPVLILAISAVASMLQIFTNMIGWKAEQLKADVESR